MMLSDMIKRMKKALEENGDHNLYIQQVCLPKEEINEELEYEEDALHTMVACKLIPLLCLHYYELGQHKFYHLTNRQQQLFKNWFEIDISKLPPVNFKLPEKD